jgi:hypothetical protein
MVTLCFNVANYRAEWQKACHKVGLGVRDKNRRFKGVRIHDLRCSAAVNLIDAGVSEDWVMKIVGWKTKAMFSRYNIANNDGLREAIERGGEYTEKKAMVRWSRGAMVQRLARSPFKAKIRVRFPLALPLKPQAARFQSSM